MEGLFVAWDAYSYVTAKTPGDKALAAANLALDFAAAGADVADLGAGGGAVALVGARAALKAKHAIQTASHVAHAVQAGSQIGTQISKEDGGGKGASSLEDNAAPEKGNQSQVSKNKQEGTRRELETENNLRQQYPNASVQREQYLRDKDGKIVKDPLTGKGRRLDHVVIENGKAVDAAETTAPNVDKTAQILKENRIREEGGTFVRDRDSGKLIDFKDIETRDVRKP